MLRSTPPAASTPFLLTPLREGRPSSERCSLPFSSSFLLTPLREGRHRRRADIASRCHFYSRPCGRGDHLPSGAACLSAPHFYSRPCGRGDGASLRHAVGVDKISTHAPAGGATFARDTPFGRRTFLLTPLREGRPADVPIPPVSRLYFYSRPCGRGDSNFPQVRHEVLRQIAER